MLPRPDRPRWQTNLRKTSEPQAFTLVEMLAVLGVIGILLALIVPAATALLRGSNLTQSGGQVSDELNFARQAAIACNRRVQVRFYKLPVPSTGNSSSYCGLQLFRVEENGQARPLTKLQALRTNIVFAADTPASSTHSTLLVPPAPAVVSVQGNDTLPAYNNQVCSYVGFQFLPDGSTDLDPTAAAATGGWFVTLVQTDNPVSNGHTPANFYTVSVEPINGHVRVFRP